MTRPSAQQPNADDVVKIAEGNVFGRYPKISQEKTFNLYIAEPQGEWLVSTPGFKKRLTLNSGGPGRGIFTSVRGGFMVTVNGNTVFRINGTPPNLIYQKLFTINTYFGKVKIDENLSGQVCITDSQALWAYNWETNTVSTAPLPTNPDTGQTIVPGYVTYHDGYIIVPDLTSARFYLSYPNDVTHTWSWGAGGVPVFTSIQTKSDDCQAVLRAPGKGNLIYVLGKTVGEMWYDNGGQTFPYQRSNSVSIDYGCLSRNTIAAMDEYIIFLGSNEKSGAAILYSSGGAFQRFSTDGIDYLLNSLVHPEQSYGMAYRISGHVCYQITFYAPEDNYTLMFDFNTNKFFFLTDENGNYHPAAAISFYADTYYFVSINDNSLYEMNVDFTNYDYTDPTTKVEDIRVIPRRKICNHHRQKDSSVATGNSFTFTLEQGEDPFYDIPPITFIMTEEGFVLTTEAATGYVGDYLTTEQMVGSYQPKIEISASYDGGDTFSNAYPYNLNQLAERQNRMIYYGFGIFNDIVLNIGIWSKGRVAISNGIFEARTGEGE